MEEQDQPIADAIVKRSYKWDGETITDQVTTDAQGNFSFPDVYQKSFMAMFAHNPAVTQGLKIIIGDKEYLAWAYQKGNYDVNGETGGKPLKMHCDLSKPVTKHELSNFKIYSGLCELK